MQTLIILITHANTASAFLEAVTSMNINFDTSSVLAYDIHNTQQPKESCEQILKNIRELNDNACSILFITDLIGSTPYNIAKKSNAAYDNNSKIETALVTGVNLPILLKALTYQTLPAQVLAEKICCTASECIIHEETK